jgi:hypothetical protein
MILALSAALALSLPQQGVPGARRAPPVVRDSIVDTTASRGGRRNRGVRRQVTAEDQRTAFKDDVAKSMLLRARVARMTMDSSLKSYDAMSYSRLSAGMSLLKIGRDRLIFRHEAAARVQWHRDVGAWIDLTGQRTVLPGIPTEGEQEAREDIGDEDDMWPIPYYPGSETLWIGAGASNQTVDENEGIIHPLADGSEAYYTYETGDSARFTLPNNTVIQLREIRFRPREPKWNLAVGSLWFDTKSAQVVRAAYRLSIPMDIWAVATAENPTSMDDVPAWVKPMITPMKAEVSAIAVEYGLHEGRFWLPRLRFAEGSAQVSFMRVPFKMEQSFKYASVNANDTLPAILLAGTAFRARMPDSLSPAQQDHWRDSVNAAARARAVALRDSIRRGLREPTRRISPCDTSDTRIITTTRSEADLRIALRVPCDLSKLENSPDLPASIYDTGEELFGMEDLEALKKEALSLSAQAPFSVRLHFLPPPSLSYGLPMMRHRNG